MMTSMRENMPLIMWILVGAFLATIVFSWGMGGFKSKGSLDGVVGKVGRYEILYDQYNRLVQERIAQQRSKDKDTPVNDDQIRQARKDVWDDLVRSHLMETYQEKWGLVTSDDEVAYAVRNTPPRWIQENENFKKDGKFDRSAYENFLRDPRSSEILVSIEKDYRMSIGNQKVIDRIIAPVFITPDEAWDDYVATNAKYTAAVVSYPLRNFTVDTTAIPTADIQAYYTKNRADYEMPETRRLSYVSIPIEATRDDSNRVLELIQEALGRARAGEDFASLATEYSEDEGSAKNGGDLGYFVTGAMVKEFDSTCFNTPPGQLAGPIVTRYGAHLIKVVDRKAGEKGDSVRASHILIKWKVGSETEERISQQAKDFADAAKTDGMAMVAKRFSLELKETDSFSKNASGNVPGFGALPPALDFAFGAKKGNISHVFRTKIRGKDTYTVFQVLDASPKKVAALSDVESSIRGTLVKKKQEEMAWDAAKKFRGRLSSAQSFFSQAASENLKIDTVGPQGTRDYNRVIGFDEQTAKSLMALPVNQISDAMVNGRCALVAVLLSKTEADPNAFQTQKTDVAERLRRTKQNTLYGDWLAQAEKEIGVVDKRYLYFTDY